MKYRLVGGSAEIFLQLVVTVVSNFTKVIIYLSTIYFRLRLRPTSPPLWVPLYPNHQFRLVKVPCKVEAMIYAGGRHLRRAVNREAYGSRNCLVFVFGAGPVLSSCFSSWQRWFSDGWCLRWCVLYCVDLCWIMCCCVETVKIYPSIHPIFRRIYDSCSGWVF